MTDPDEAAINEINKNSIARRRRRNSLFTPFDEQHVLQLVLTTARVLRAQIRSAPHMTAQDTADSNMLTEVLMPFEVKPEEGNKWP